jgi:hypothetical protein
MGMITVNQQMGITNFIPWAETASLASGAHEKIQS